MAAQVAIFHTLLVGQCIECQQSSVKRSTKVNIPKRLLTQVTLKEVARMTQHYEFVSIILIYWLKLFPGKIILKHLGVKHAVTKRHISQKKKTKVISTFSFGKSFSLRIRFYWGPFKDQQLIEGFFYYYFNECRATSKPQVLLIKVVISTYFTFISEWSS